MLIIRLHWQLGALSVGLKKVDYVLAVCFVSDLAMIFWWEPVYGSFRICVLWHVVRACLQDLGKVGVSTLTLVGVLSWEGLYGLCGPRWVSGSEWSVSPWVGLPPDLPWWIPAFPLWPKYPGGESLSLKHFPFYVWVGGNTTARQHASPGDFICSGQASPVSSVLLHTCPAI